MKSAGVQMMTEGSLTREIISFSLPLIFGNLMQQLYNTADSVIVGQLVGSNALAAVGAGTALINLLIAFSQGAATGAGVVIAQQLGACSAESRAYGLCDSTDAGDRPQRYGLLHGTNYARMDGYAR